ncbi:hypothetical protein EDL79_01330 [Ehrlichia ruminantium]|nr:hypothetical protein [Ehrlichia ruminantium]QGR02322.1 hypothetical protein EDL81_01330 [Ehrlichia ruminantium]QGR04167.1 hypothetical protein EDL79_01330 [Ehrlichia ruminantium]
MHPSNIALAFLLGCIIYGILVALITVLIRHIIFSKTKNQVTSSKNIPGLSENDLSQMFDSANTKLHKLDSLYSKVNILVDKSTIDETRIESTYDEQKIQSLDHYLTKQHIEYLNKSRNDNDPDNHSRAILGASLHSIFLTEFLDKDKVPNMPLIHHMINYIYSSSYINLLSDIINQAIPIKEKHPIKEIHTSKPAITLQYYSRTQEEFAVDIEFDQKIIRKDRAYMPYSFTGHIHFSISQLKDTPEVLQYSQGEVLIHSNNVLDNVELWGHKSMLKFTIPSFTVNAHSAQQTVNIPVFDTITNSKETEVRAIT